MLDDELADEPSNARAKRAADGGLTKTSAPAHEREVRDVHDGQQQHEHDGHEQDSERRTDRTDDHRRERLDVGATRLVLGIRLFQVRP